MNRTSPLKVVVGGYQEWGSDVSFPERRERLIIRLMYEREIAVGCLQTPQESIVPDSKIYIRIGYKRGGECEG